MSTRSMAALSAVISLPIFAVVQASAQTAGTSLTNCLGGPSRGYSCVTSSHRGDLNPHIITVPQPVSEQERTEMQQRERLWLARCRPVVRQDEYGVARYSYAARGCEFGKLD